MNYAGSWNLVENLVLHHIDQQCSELGIRCRMLLIYRWLLLAATHPDVDLTSTLKQVLATTFDMSCLDKILNFGSTSMADSKLPGTVTLHWAYEEPTLGDDLMDRRYLRQKAKFCLASRMSYTSNAPFYPRNPAPWAALDPCEDFAVPHSASIEASWLKQSVREIADPGAETVCIICKDDFEEIPCIAPNVCEHQFHLTCILSWQVRLKSLGVLDLECCYCRKMIVEGRKMAEEEGLLRLNQKPFFWTPEHRRKGAREHAKWITKYKDLRKEGEAFEDVLDARERAVLKGE